MANIIIGHASIDERGKSSGGQAGDQTKKEVCTRSYYLHKKGWYLLRPKNITHANAIAKSMLRACNNDNIGYDQSNRLGIIKYGTNSSVKTECDCSSLVRQCVKEGTGVDAGNFNTSTEKSMLLSTGLFESAITVTSSTTLYNGDILVTKTKGHTVIVISGNPRITTDTACSYLMKGDSGIEVKTLQNNLNYIGYPCGTADGKFGTNTDSALRKFQKDYGLTVDGKYGADSKKKLEEAVEKKKNSSAKHMYDGLDYSPVFDPTYYANNYTDLKNAFGNDVSSLWNHFKVNGMKEGRVASAEFNVTVYKNRYADLQKAFGNNLPNYYKHYIQFGRTEGRCAV